MKHDLSDADLTSSEDEFMEEIEETSTPEAAKIFLPGDEIPQGMQLDWDRAAYTMMHEASAEWPCLSFDFIDKLPPTAEFPFTRETQAANFPWSLNMVAGSQAASNQPNFLYLIHAHSLTSTYYNSEDSESEDSDSETSDLTPQLQVEKISHQGAVNRVRCSGTHCASWSDNGNVYLWNLQGKLPISTLKMDTEGFGLAFSPQSSTSPCRLLAGSLSGQLQMLTLDNPNPNQILVGKSIHGSIEDLQWSPSEGNVFAAASGTSISLWDLRAGKTVLQQEGAHLGSDVNVLSWNSTVQYLIATGGDEGAFKVWDLRALTPGGEIASIDWHKGNAITSIEWKAGDSSVLAVSDSLDQVTLWDMSLEADEPEAEQPLELEDRKIPPQLLFVHQGMQQPKEIHWHSKISGLVGATALSGFNLFQTVNVK
jgi:ribosome assembly protein RRB1